MRFAISILHCLNNSTACFSKGGSSYMVGVIFSRGKHWEAFWREQFAIGHLPHETARLLNYTLIKISQYKILLMRERREAPMRRNFSSLPFIALLALSITLSACGSNVQ